jgi:hypothetical protein
MSSDPRHRPQSARVQHRCPGGARGSTVPAGRQGFFLEGDLASVINPPTGKLGGDTAKSRTPTTRPGSCGSSAPRPGWSPAYYSIYTYHTMNGTRSDCSHYICSSRPLPASAPAWVKASRYPTHRLRGGDNGLPPVRLVGRTRRVGGHLAVAPQEAIAGEPGTRAPHVAVITSGGREISTIDLYGRRFVLLAGLVARHGSQLRSA